MLVRENSFFRLVRQGSYGWSSNGEGDKSRRIVIGAKKKTVRMLLDRAMVEGRNRIKRTIHLPLETSILSRPTSGP